MTTIITDNNVAAVQTTDKVKHSAFFKNVKGTTLIDATGRSAINEAET